MGIKERLKKFKIMCWIYETSIVTYRRWRAVFAQVFNKNIWLSTSDLMMPVDGEMTWFQAIVCTRLLDLLSISNGGVADNSIVIHKNRNSKQDYEDLIEDQNLWWSRNYSVLANYGYNPLISQIDCTYKYVSVGTSTHRMAFCPKQIKSMCQ